MIAPSLSECCQEYLTTTTVQFTQMSEVYTPDGAATKDTTSQCGIERGCT